MPTRTPTLLALDATNLLHRAYYALEQTQMRNRSGAPVWALHGFVSSLAKYLEPTNPTSLLAAFDLKGGCPSRRALAPSYKQGRSPTPVELTDQLLILPEILAAFGVTVATTPDWEADDLLASAAASASASGARAVILSSDKDAHQVISDRVVVYKPEGVFADESYIVNKYQIAPSRWIEYAALVGEGADNLPGVSGIGPKRASTILGAFADVEDAISDPASLSRVTSPKIATALVEGADTFRTNRLVGTLRTDLTFDTTRLRLSNLDPAVIIGAGEHYEIPAAARRLVEALQRLGD